MSNLDGRILDEFTEGINAPVGPEDAGKLAVVNDEGTNFRYATAESVLSGIPGLVGPTGATGPFGGAVAIPYGFVAGTSDVSPGPGGYAVDDADLNAASVLRVSVTGADGRNYQSVLETFDDSTSTAKGLIRLVSADDPTLRAIFRVDGLSLGAGGGTTYLNLAVTHLASSVATIANAVVCFDRTGDRGETGATGATGDTGPTGATGPTLGWSASLAISATSGANNPTIDAGQHLRFGSTPAASGQIRGTGATEIRTTGAMSVRGDSALTLTAAAGQATIQATGGNVLLAAHTAANICQIAAAGATLIESVLGTTIRTTAGITNITAAGANLNLAAITHNLTLAASAGSISASCASGIDMSPGTDQPVRIASGLIRLIERAAGIALSAGQALFFAKSDSPNNPYFRDDTNVDRKILTAPAALTDIATIAAGAMLGNQIDAGGAAAPKALTGAEQGENYRANTRQTVGSLSGTIDIALNDDTTILVLQLTGDATLRSLGSTAAGDGRLLRIEHDSGAFTLTIGHNLSSPTYSPFYNPSERAISVRRGATVNARTRSGFWRPEYCASVAPLELAAIASNIAVSFVIRVAFTAGGGGAADDVTIYAAAAPFAFRIVDVTVLVATAVALATLQLRDTTGGGGATLSSSLSAAATGTVRNNDTATRTVAAAGSVYLRRSDNGVAGEVIIVAVRT